MIPTTTDTSVLAEWRSLLMPCNDILRSLAGATENEFLSIGSQMQDFYQRSTELAEQANRLATLVSGTQGRELIDRLQQMIRDMEMYLAQTATQSNESCSTLQTVLAHLDTISEPLQGFQKMTKALRMLGISTKIESARMGEAGLGFLTLALDVEKLSHEVSEKSGNILGHRQRLATMISANLRLVSNSQRDQGSQVRGVLTSTSGSLDQLLAINSRCTTLGELVSSVSGEVANNISEIVASMQMHDMTRQQVEHSVEALEKVIAKLDELHNSCESPEQFRHLVVEIGDVCELQEAQIRFASSALCGAVTIIIDNLRQVGSMQEQMAHETVAVTGATDSNDHTFMDSIKNGLLAVTEVLARCAVADQEMSQTLLKVAETLQEVTNFVSDIEQIGSEIDLIALNSQIKAALTGDEGAALGVLAEAVKRLSVDAITQSDAVSRVLNEINSATRHLFSEANQETENLMERIGVMEVEIRDILSGLTVLNQDMMTLLSQLGGRVTGLTEDIDAATSGLDVHIRVKQMAAEVMQKLDSIVTAARRIEPASNEFKNNLKYMEERYTMESERHIHEAIAHKRSGGMSAIDKAHGQFAKQVAASSDDSEFGDNIDLF